MSARIDTPGPAETINLADTADFDLGALRVQPSRRRVSGGAQEDLVEPRVMQVLIALAEAGGAVLSRDALIERCWGGRIVGEDAINRCIAKVRRLADTVQPAAFTIETVAKVGYRLQTSRALDTPAPEIERAPLGPVRIADASPGYFLAHTGRDIHGRTNRKYAPGWREAGIAAFVVIVGVAASVTTRRPAAPVTRTQSVALATPVSPPPGKIANLPSASTLSQGGTTNQLAFDAYLRGQHHMQEGFDDKDAALAEFQRAVELDPDYALALVGLSAMLTLHVNHVMRSDDPQFHATMAGARRAAERAASIAPGLGLPHSQIGIALLSGGTDFDAAWAEARRALALSPDDATVQENVAAIAMSAGRPSDALEAASRAVELDPMHAEPWFTKMRVLTCLHEFDQARDALRQGIAVLGHAPIWQPYILGSLLLKQGKPDEARQVCEAGSAWVDECLAIAYHALGRQKEAEANVARMIDETGDDNSYNLAGIYAQWNQPDLAMRWLNKARQINDTGLPGLECDAFLDPIRSKPGFHQIEQSLHLPPPGP